METNHTFPFGKRQLKKYIKNKFVREGLTPEERIYDLTNAERRIYNLFIDLQPRFRSVMYFSQQYIAGKLDLCRETVNRAIQRLSEYGLIRSERRGVRKSGFSPDARYLS